MRPVKYRRRSACCILLISCLLHAQKAEVKSTECSNRFVPQLVDVTKKTGITFRHTSAPEKKYIVESMSGGVLLIDYDRDGWLDIYFPNAPTVDMALRKEKARSALYHNNHDGTFTDVTEKAGVAFPCFAMGGAVGDFNNDGWPDMYITCLGANVLYKNNGDGTFTDVAVKAGVADPRWSAGAAFADYDGDGFVDLFVSNYVDFRLNDLPGFGKAATCRFRGIDVQCGPRGLKGAGDSLYHNNGDGTFTDVTKEAGMTDPSGYYGLGVAWADFNDRGKIDLFVADDATPNYFYRNEGHNKFTEIGLESGTAVSADGAEQACMGVAVGDYLHTGKPGIFATNFADEYNVLYRNDGDFNFTDVSYQAQLAAASLPYVGWGAGFLDLDNDGWLDLLSVNGHVYPQVDTLSYGARYREPKLLFMNNQNGSFCDASKDAGPALQELRVSRGAAFGDPDNDGHVDVVVADLDGGPMVLHNNAGDGNHWITFELAGKKSNRLAIGTRLKLTTGKVVQTEEVRSGTSYLSQNDLRVHFGIGKATVVDALEIRWPSGRSETLKNIAPDKFYSILEGEGIVPETAIRPGATALSQRAK